VVRFSDKAVPAWSQALAPPMPQQEARDARSGIPWSWSVELSSGDGTEDGRIGFALTMATVGTDMASRV
jgi:hypothetical protein